MAIFYGHVRLPTGDSRVGHRITQPRNVGVYSLVASGTQRRLGNHSSMDIQWETHQRADFPATLDETGGGTWCFRLVMYHVNPVLGNSMTSVLESIIVIRVIRGFG